MATNDEIERLKHNWLGDPCWDIEETEGFEEHKEELIAFRKQHEAEVEKRLHEQLEKRVKLMKDETGIIEANVAMYLHTFADIEIVIKNASIGDAPTRFELAMAEIAQAQARATLLLAAQVKRVADVLEEQAEEHQLELERQETRELFRME
jgi:hypothetical protein